MTRLLILVLLYSVCWVHGQAGEDGPNETVVVDPASALNYLALRGWLPTGNDASELIDLETYIRNFQMYAGIAVTGELDVATKAKMNSPRCGVPDFGPEGFQMTATRSKRFTRLGSMWPNNDLTWFLQGTSTDLPRNTIIQQLTDAFQYWADTSALKFQQATSESNADIIVNFYRSDHADGNPFDGPGNVLAHAFGPGRGRGGDMHFDDDETFSAGPGINLLQVAVHEIGHSLGLGHSSDNTAIMAPFYSYRSNYALGTDDILGIQTLYGPPSSNPPTRPPPPPPPVTQAPTLPTTTPPRTLRPLFCNAQFDAATESFDDNAYFFQGTMVIKVSNFAVVSGYPRPISEEFPGVPSFVDAAFLWQTSTFNKYIYIFKGSQYWRFYNGQASLGYPRSIAAWGLPANIDGAFRWPGNQRIYFFKGDQYYRYNTMSYSIDAGYPRSLGVWRNVAAPVSAVLDLNGRTYFFNDQYFQIFSDSSFQASGNSQTAPAWLGCRTEGLIAVFGTTEFPTTLYEEEDDDRRPSDNGGIATVPSLFVILLTSLASLWCHIL